MRFNKILPGLSVLAMAMLSPMATAAPATGAVSFDMEAFSSTLQSNASAFSGWSFYSEAASNYATSSHSASAALAIVNSSVSGASASTGAGSLFTSAQAGGVSNAYQRVNATFELAAGKHLIYEIPYSLSLNRAIATQQLDVGLAFRIESSDIEYTVYRTVSTATWPAQGGQPTENSVLVIDLFNTRDVAQTYSIAGTLRADDFGPTVAVPEPATYAFLLLGLGLVTLTVRSRKRAS
jgi:hypothetical protein